MARPKDADPAQTLDNIVAAARELIFADGTEPALDVSLRAIAERAGVSFGTLSYYFPSREQLLERCLDPHYERVDDLLDELIRRASAPSQPREVVELATRRFFRLASSGRAEVLLQNATTARRGALHPERTSGLERYLDAGAAVLAGLAGMTEHDARLAIHSTMTLIMRYATMDDAELEAILGATGPDARRQLEDHVVRVTLRITLAE
jgi:AcrR family transcriptional regulator